MKVDPDLVVPTKELSIAEGAIKASGWYYYPGGMVEMYHKGLSEAYGYSVDTPFKNLPAKVKKVLFYGTGSKKITFTRGNDMGTYSAPFEGIINNLERRFRETQSNFMRDEIAQVMSSECCPDCHGDRLKSGTVGGYGGRSQHFGFL